MGVSFVHVNCDDFQVANFNEQCICIKFCLKLRKTPSDMQETESVFAVVTQQANSSPVSGKTIAIHV